VASELAQPRAAGEIVDGERWPRQHGVGVGEPEGGRQVGQVGAEGEHVAPARAPRGRVQEGQQQARIALHRAGHVDQHQQRQRLARAAAGQPQQLAARARRLVQRSVRAQCRLRAARAGRVRRAGTRAPAARCRARAARPGGTRRPTAR
jgi:hypothetical protein